MGTASIKTKKGLLATLALIVALAASFGITQFAYAANAPWADGTEVKFFNPRNTDTGRKGLGAKGAATPMFDAFCMNRTMDMSKDNEQRFFNNATNTSANDPIVVMAIMENETSYGNTQAYTYANQENDARAQLKRVLYYGYIGNKGNLGLSDSDLYDATQMAVWQVCHFGEGHMTYDYRDDSWNRALAGTTGGFVYGSAAAKAGAARLLHYAFDMTEVNGQWQYVYPEPNMNLYIGKGTGWGGTVATLSQNIITGELVDDEPEPVDPDPVDPVDPDPVDPDPVDPDPITPDPVDPDPVSVAIEINKAVQGDQISSYADAFTFELLDESGTVLQTKTNDGSGKVTFDEIEYNAAGTYNYKVREVAGNNPSIIYDTTEKDITVTVTGGGTASGGNDNVEVANWPVSVQNLHPEDWGQNTDVIVVPGVVDSTTNEAITGAQIQIVRASNGAVLYRWTSNTTGETIRLRAGESYILKAVKNGYEIEDRTFEVKAGVAAPNNGEGYIPSSHSTSTTTSKKTVSYQQNGQSEASAGYYSPKTVTIDGKVESVFCGVHYKSASEPNFPQRDVWNAAGWADHSPSGNNWTIGFLDSQTVGDLSKKYLTWLDRVAYMYSKDYSQRDKNGSAGAWQITKENPNPPEVLRGYDLLIAVKKLMYNGYPYNAAGITDTATLRKTTQEALFYVMQYGQAYKDDPVKYNLSSGNFRGYSGVNTSTFDALVKYALNNEGTPGYSMTWPPETEDAVYVYWPHSDGNYGQNSDISGQPLIGYYAPYDGLARVTTKGCVASEPEPLTAEVTSAPVTITNHKPAPAEAWVTVSKKITGANAPAVVNDMFKFWLYDQNGDKVISAGGADGSRMIKASSNPNENAKLWNAFHLTFDKEGTYTYTIREDQNYRADGINYDNITFDDTAKEVTIVVTFDKASNSLKATVNGAAGHDTNANACNVGTFTNTYKEEEEPTPTTVRIQLKKELQGPDKPALKSGMFKFLLLDEQGNEVDRRWTNNQGSLNYALQANFSKEGTYTYTIKEDVNYEHEACDYSNVLKDAPAQTVTIVVTKDQATNSLRATVNGSSAVPYTISQSFINHTTPKPAKARITAMKKLVDGNNQPVQLQGGEFEFELLDYNGNPTGKTARNDANGNIDFGELEFSRADNFGFSIRELVPPGATSLGNNKYLANNIIYDCSKINADVSVTTNSDGTLKATPKANVVITNEKHEPSIATTAKGADGNVLDAGIVQIEDTVQYTNLIPGTSYELTGTLHLQGVDGNGNLVNRGTVSASDVKIKGTNGCTFTPTSADGEVVMVFTVDTSNLKGENIVVFENLTMAGSGIFVADHKDITDPEQTVTVDNPGAETGSIKIAKVDDEGNTLAGATLVLKRGADVIQRFENFSGAETLIEGLQPGTYTLIEESAPTGYDTADPISFEVVAGQTADPTAASYTGLTQTAASGTAIPGVSNFAIMANTQLLAEASCVEPLNAIPSIATESYIKVDEKDYSDLSDEVKQKIKRIVYAYAYENTHHTTLINSYFTRVSNMDAPELLDRFTDRKVNFPQAGMYLAARDAIEHVAGATYDRKIKKSGTFGDVPGAYNYFLTTVANDTSIDAKVKNLHLIFFRTTTSNNQNLVPLRLFADPIVMVDKPKEEVPVKVKITAKKEFVGTDENGQAVTLQPGQFTFQLLNNLEQAVIRDGQPVIATNDAEGNIDFGVIEKSTQGSFAYHVAEVKGTDTGIIYDDTVKKIVFTVTKNSDNVFLVNGANETTVEAYTFKNKKPSMGTTAVGADGNKLLPVDDEVTVVDTVAYNDLKPNTKYTLSGKLVDKVTGQPIAGTEQTVTFTSSNSGTGTTTMTFVVDTRKLQGHSLVAFETITLGTDFELKHENIEDPAQTVEVDKPTIDIAGTKTWDDGNNNDGKRPTAITITLKGSDGSSQDKTVRDPWTYEFKGLPQFDDEGNEIKYTVTEVQPEGYTASYANDSYDITNTYNPGKVSIRVVKNWVDENNKDNIQPESVTVNLLANGVATGQTAVLNAGNRWECTFENLDEYKDGTKITYTVTEDEVAGYRVAIEGSAAEGFIITNTHPTIATTATDASDNDKTVDAADNVVIKDVVEYKNLQPGKEYTMVGTLHNKADGQDGPAIATSDPVTFTASATGAGTVDIFFTVDTRALQGQKLVAFESCQDNGIEVASHADINDPDQTVEVDKPTTQIAVSKAWTSTDGTPAQPSEPVIVTLLCNGVATSNQKVLLAANDWTAVFTDLSKLDENGDEYEYTVEETLYNTGEFTSAITGTAAEGFVVTNTKVDQPGPEPWIGTTATDAADGDKNVVAEPLATVVDTVAYGNLPAGNYVMKGQLLKKSNQSVLATAEKEFTVAEDYVEGTVDLTFTFDASELANTSAVAFEECYEADDDFVVAADAEPIADHKEIDDPDQTVDITEPEIGTTAVDAADGDKFIPAKGSATVVDTVAYTNLTPGKEYVLTGKLMNKETGEAIVEGTPVTFTPETANGTVEMTFTIDDCSEIAGKSAVAYEYVGVVVEGDVKPVAEHENPEDPDQTVYVPTVGTSASAVEPVDGDPKVVGVGTVDIIDTVTYTNLIPGKEYTLFGKLVNKADGSDIKGATATTTFTPNEANGTVKLTFTVDTRTLQGEQLVAFETLTCEGKFVADHKEIDDPAQTVEVDKPTTTVSGTKTWEGDEDALDQRPAMVHVRLLANGTQIDEADIPDEHGSWTYEFTDLPVYDEQGVKITYTVTEDAVENYASEATETAAGVDFKNVYTPDETSVTVTKKWNDNDNAAAQRPAFITVNLLADEAVAATAELTAQNNWTHTFNNLTVGPDYSVEEVAVEGYEGEISGDAATGFIITNTKPTVTTDAAGEDGNKELAQGAKVKIVDQITYTNLTPGKEYVLTGTLMNKNTGEPLNVEGSTVTVDPFVPAQANGTYDMTFEIDTTALKGAAIVVFEEVFYEDIPVCAHTDITDDDQTVYVPEIGTTATDSETNDHIAKADEQVTIIDSVHYEGLVPGKAYTMEGTLYKKNADGSQGDALATAGKGFTAEEDGEGYVDLSFTFNGSALAGASAVAFEAIKDGEVTVATHADINDADQTVDFPEAETNATNENGGKELAQGETVTVVDKVTYTNLLPGKTYTITGKLMDKETGLPLDDAGATASIELVLGENDPRDGEVELTFTINTTSLQGKAIVAFEKVLYEGKEVAVHEDITDEDQTVYVPEIGTTATDSETNDHIAKADEQVTINDAVQYSGLVPGKEYTMVGQLHKKSDPAQTVGGTVEKTFTASATGAGEVVLTFVIDARELAGDAVVAFEAAYEGTDVAAAGTPVATHEDPNDPDQTVELPEAKTNAFDKADNNKVVEPDAQVTIVDTVSYENLLPNKDYTVYGQLVTKDDAQRIIATASTSFNTGDKVNGDVELEFTFNATQLQGQQVVVFETVYYKGIEVAVHADINDPAQTVTVRENPTVEISKVDATTSEELPGAALIIRDEADRVVESWTSGTESHKVQLAPGTYTLTEITAPNGYEVAESITFRVDENGLVDGEKVVMEDAPAAPETIKVTVNKVWDLADGEEAPEAISVQLTANGVAEGEAVELTAPNWTYTWDNLAKFDADDAVIDYAVTEIVPDGYYQTKSESKMNGNGDVTITFTNAPVPPEPEPEKITVTAKKLWEGVTEGQPNVSVQLTRDGNAVGSAVELTAPNWTYTWDNLDKTDAAGAVYNYAVTEVEPAGYTQVKLVTTMDGEGNMTTTFTNKKDPEPEPEPEIGTVATDANDGDKLVNAEPETKIKDVVHYENLIAGKTYRLEGQLVNKKTEEVVATAWTTFVAVEGGTGDAELIFTVDTSKLAGEKVVAFETVKDGRVVVATHSDLSDGDQTVDVTTPTVGTTATGADGNKIIANEANVKVIDVVEYNNLTPGRTYTLSGQLVTKSSDGEVVVAENSATFVAADVQPATTELVFTVDCTDLAGEKLVAYEAVYYSGTKIAEHKDITDKDQTVTVETPVEPEPEFVSIDVTKVWKDAEGNDAEPGQAVTVELLANGQHINKFMVVEAPTWTATFADMPKHDVDGNEITYTVVEKTYDSANYTCEVTGSAAEGFTVTNTKKPEEPPVTIIPEIEISKVDASTKGELPGAELVITNAAGEEVDRWTSGTTPHKIRLGAGTYTLTEITAPFGYQVAESITFEVDGNGLVDGDKVVMEDQPETVLEDTTEAGAAEIHKAWYNDANIAEYVAVTFEAQYSFDGVNWVDSGKTVKVTGQAIDKDGMWVAVFEGLPVKVNGQDVMWRAIESKTAGYEQAITTIAGPNGMTAANLVENPNEPVAGVAISKYATDTEALLPGAKLQLLKDGVEIATWTSTATPYRTTLEAGTYVLHEVSAPTGYDVAADVTFTIDQTQTVDFSTPGATFDPENEVKVDMYDKPTEPNNPDNPPIDEPNDPDKPNTPTPSNPTPGSDEDKTTVPKVTGGGGSSSTGGYTPSGSTSSYTPASAVRGQALAAKTSDMVTFNSMLVLAAAAAASALVMGLSLRRSRKQK